MISENNYLEVNLNSWNNRVEAHLKSEFYDMEGFMKGNSSLNEIELKLLGDVKGKSILHLQCHFGQDSISLSRMGARVTGIDLSDKAIQKAEEIAKATQTDAKFICCDLYNLPKHLDEKFDIVFTSYGTIGWLPDMDKWAKIVSQYLKPGGQFVFVEFHPVVWMFDDNFEKITYSYFNTGAIIDTEQGTYADKEANITVSNVTWNHSMGEVVNSLIKNGLEILSLNEFD
jgi:2-polyprenyl-3-methyl-5-hydroxy-6-metoxy-1,4-benzoquinol methylase